MSFESPSLRTSLALERSTSSEALAKDDRPFQFLGIQSELRTTSRQNFSGSRNARPENYGALRLVRRSFSEGGSLGEGGPYRQFPIELESIKSFLDDVNGDPEPVSKG